MSQALALWIVAVCLLIVAILRVASAVLSNGRVPRSIKFGQVSIVPFLILLAVWLVKQAQLQDDAAATGLETWLAIAAMAGTVGLSRAIVVYTRVWLSGR